MWILAYIGYTLCLYVLDNKRDRKMSRARIGETFSTFRASLNLQSLDPKITKLVYEAFQQEVAYPIRAADTIKALGLDFEDVEDMIIDIATKAKRSLNEYEVNPYYEQLDTINGIIQFLCHQKSYVE